ncbi:MAG: DUF5343 domain-containing protein [Methanoregula sp.]|jgi:hypothetical protein|uniref:DUF5343 domain-containing protein n=1 Tax=Methanoregula sp. TaxID=2052170 RepID=UPI003C19F27D
MEFPLHKNPKKLVDFFGIIQSEQVPSKVNKDFLHLHNFKSSYDESIPKIMEQLEFVGSGRTPNERWKRYRDASQSKKVMAEAIRIAYAEMFKVFSNPLQKSKDELKNFFKGKTDLNDEQIGNLVATFDALCSLADFNQTSDDTSSSPTEDISQKSNGEGAVKIQKVIGHGQYTVNLNIQLQLPETTNPDVYDKLFESMKKHLFS